MLDASENRFPSGVHLIVRSLRPVTSKASRSNGSQIVWEMLLLRAVTSSFVARAVSCAEQKLQLLKQASLVAVPRTWVLGYHPSASPFARHALGKSVLMGQCRTAVKAHVDMQYVEDMAVQDTQGVSSSDDEDGLSVVSSLLLLCCLA